MMNRLNSKKQFDIENGVITNIKPYEICLTFKDKIRVYGNSNDRSEIENVYIPLYWYANSEEESRKLKKAILEAIDEKRIDGVTINKLTTIIIDVSAKAIGKDAGTNKGIEKAIICSDIPLIDEKAFDDSTNIINARENCLSKRR